MKTFNGLFQKLEDAIQNCQSTSELEQVRVAVFGKKGILKEIEALIWK